MSEALELELEVTMSRPVWMLGLRLGSSARTLNLYAMSRSSSSSSLLSHPLPVPSPLLTQSLALQPWLTLSSQSSYLSSLGMKKRALPYLLLLFFSPPQTAPLPKTV